jgi:PAS domain S-box-containing protein
MSLFRKRVRLVKTAGVVVSLAFLLLFSPCSLLGSEIKQSKRILILYSFDKEQGIYVRLDESLRSRLISQLPDRVEFYTEYLDLIRFPDPGHADNLVRLLRLRLAEIKPDLLIPVGYTALNFVLSSGKDLFPHTPIVALFNERREGDLKLSPEQLPFMTGIKGKDDPRPTVDLALRLQPDTRRVAVVVGSSPNEKFWLEQLRTELTADDGKITFTYLTDLSMDRLLKQLAELPPHTIILYTYFSQDANGQFFLPEEALDLIGKASHVPVYGIYSSYIGHGVVGGRMADPERTGAAIADLAVRVLSGERAGDIPMLVNSSSRDTVDWRQLRRWGISERRLQPGSVVLFKEPSIWSRYLPYIIGLLFLFIVEALAIVGLLIEREKRRRAEKQLLSEKQFSDAVIESLPGVFFMQDTDFKNIRWNKNAERLVRYHPSQAGPLGNVVEKYKNTVRQRVRETFEKGAVSDAEAEMLGPGDTTLHFQFSANRVDVEGKPYIIGVGIDISKRKQAEEELRLSEARFSSAFEYAPIGMALVAPDGRWMKVNRTLCDLLGYTSEEMQMKTF